VTVESLNCDLSAMGVQPGMVLLVHASLSALGWVSGGAVAVILALEQALGLAGTLVMPAHSTNLTDPEAWRHPPVPASWWQVIRDTVPGYDPALTPTRGIGVIPETFRKQTGVLRSGHPTVSFAAWGAQADLITSGHGLAFGMGEGSPLARIYDLDGWVLLMGVGHSSNSSLHLAEYRASYPGKQLVLEGTAVMRDGRRQWVTYPDISTDSDDFGQVGEAFDMAGQGVRIGRVGYGSARLMSQRALVDFAVSWMESNRGVVRR